jgi:flavin reductase (DIM6/NTAB) family NADH-FMN oxidoreductase RutF
MTLVFCPGYRADGTPKDSLMNSLPTAEGGLGEFVVNASVESYAREIAASAKGLPHGQSEFALIGLTPEPSRVVSPPRVAEAPVSFECVTIRAFQVDPSEPLSSWLIVGKVVHVWVREDLLDGKLNIDADGLAAIGRMGGADYALTRERFALGRGPSALDETLPFTPRGSAP